MHESARYTQSNEDQIEARQELFSLMEHYPATIEERERSLGLFLRASLLARLLAIHEIYEHIVSVPGVIFDIGTWRGQTAVICENLRAILEPLNQQRRIVAFDTFQGYAGMTTDDSRSKTWKEGSYSLPEDYAELLQQLLVIHERNNIGGHLHGKHKVVAGDCVTTIPQHLKENPHETVALAWFDLNAFNPTRAAFEAIHPRIPPGGILAFWQLTRPELTAEGKCYHEVISPVFPHQLFRSKYYPSLSYLVRQPS